MPPTGRPVFSVVPRADLPLMRYPCGPLVPTMRTLLVLAQHPEMAEAVRSAANPEHYRVLHRVSAEEAEPLLAHGLVSACIVDLDLTSVQAIWLIEKLHRRAPNCPILVFSGTKEPQWEEE